MYEKKEVDPTSWLEVASITTIETTNQPPPRAQQLYIASQLSDIRAWLNAPVRDDMIIEIELLALAFSTGMQDATTYPNHFCFTSNQTGNTIFLSVGVTGIEPSKGFSFPNIGFALSLFLIGAFMMGQMGNIIGTRRRLWLLASNIMQTLMVISAAIVAYSVPVATTGPSAWAILSLLAFSSGGQVAMARGLKITEITTAMATSAYVDVLVDPMLWSFHNRPRNRRVAFLLTLCAGSFAGAYSHRNLNPSFALVLSAIIKTGVTIAFVFNRGVPASGPARSEP